jgi:multicomponent Na+:H+ antiporter subunit F
MIEWTALYLVMPTLAVSALAAAARVLHGPTLPDRVVALDLVATIVMGMACTWAIATGEAAFLDVALVLALVAFLGTIAFARYLERQGASS